MVATGSRRRGALLTAAVVCGCILLCAPAARAGEAVVTAPDAVVRTAPFDVAPALTHVHAGDKLTADDRPLGTWRRVKLPDGRFGVVHDADVKVTVAAPAPPPAVEASSPREVTAKGAVAVKIDEAAASTSGAPANAAPAAAVTTQGTAAATGPSTLIGVMFAIMPAGSMRFDRNLQSTPTKATADAASAVAVAPFIDVAVSPYVAFGFSPQIILHVKAEGDSGQSATEYDLRARLTARAPVSPTANLFGRFSPGFSIIDIPSGDSGGAITLSDPLGLLLDFSVGAEVAFQPNLFFVSELGYQLGFQSAKLNDTAGNSMDVALNTRYLHFGIGLAVRL